MKLSSKITTLCVGITTLCFLGPGHVSAISYETNVGVQFTFNSSLSVNISDDLLIDNLTPGNSSDSNIITVGVSTNSVAGYVLSATVGTKTGASTALTNTANSSYNFANLSTTPGSAANLAAFNNNQWGYSYCRNTVANCGSGGSATWISGSVGADGAAGSSTAGYSGLPLDNNDNADERGKNGVTLINTTDSSSGLNSVQFKIGAKASSTQPSGTYTNTINFYAVSYVAPVSLYEAYQAAGATMVNGHYRIQDMTSSICSNTTAEESELQVVDTRDGKLYWIAKLKDGHCWMTQNLDLDLDSSTALTYSKSDIGHGSNPTVFDWYPARSTYAATSTQVQEWCNGGTISGGDCTNSTPESYDPGNLYWNLTVDDYYSDYWGPYESSCSWSTNPITCNQSLNPISNYTSSTGNAHYHLGNYYNWSAAIATNDSSIYTNNEVVEQSICPAGWTLPNTGSGDGSFQALWEESYNCYSYSGNISTMWSSPLYFIPSGYYKGLLLNTAYQGSFWTSTADSSSSARNATFLAMGAVYSNVGNIRGSGFSVRCIAR